MRFKINKRSNTPLYKQLENELGNLIEEGIFKLNDKLPTENELIRDNDISKGTIKKAYAELEKRNYVKIVQGSGTYVSIDVNNLSVFEGEKLIRDTLEKLAFVSSKEIYNIFQKEMNNKFKDNKKIKIAWIDCCEEDLEAAANQIASIKNTTVVKILVDDLRNSKVSLDDKYNIVATTQNHYSEVLKLNSNKYLSVKKLALKLSDATISEIVRLEEDKRVAILYRSDNFIKNVKEKFKMLGKENEIVSCKYNDKFYMLDGDLNETSIMFVPVDYLSTKNVELLNIIHKYLEEGKRIVPFEYVIDKGSLYHLEREIYNMSLGGSMYGYKY